MRTAAKRIFGLRQLRRIGDKRTWIVAPSKAAPIRLSNGRNQNVNEPTEQGRDGERVRADALRDRLDVLQAQLTTMEAEGAESDVAVAQLTAQLNEARLHAEGVLHAAETRHEAEATARRSLGRLARLRAAWRGGMKRAMVS